MLCDKCGKSNINDLSKCAHCGAEMPKTSACGGFADILSYLPPKQETKVVATVVPEREEKDKGERISDLDLQKLLKKSDKIIRSTKRNSLFGLVAVALSALILITSLAVGIIAINSVKQYKEEILAQLEEVKQEISGRKTETATSPDEVVEDNNKSQKIDESLQETQNQETETEVETETKTGENVSSSGQNEETQVTTNKTEVNKNGE